MLILKPLSEDRSRSFVQNKKNPNSYFHYARRFTTYTLAHMLDSLVRVSRRVEKNYLVSVLDRPRFSESLARNNQRLLRRGCSHLQRPNAFLNRDKSLSASLENATTNPKTPHKLPRARNSRWLLAARSTLKRAFKYASNLKWNLQHSAVSRQSISKKLVSFAYLLAISGTFNSLSKVLFTFPSRYLFAIGLESIFSFRRKLPPLLHSTSKERDSTKTSLKVRTADETGLSPSLMLSSKKTCARVCQSVVSQDYNSPIAAIYSLSSSRFIRHY